MIWANSVLPVYIGTSGNLSSERIAHSSIRIQVDTINNIVKTLICHMRLGIPMFLNRTALLGPNDENVHSTINGKWQELPFSIEGKLSGHVSFLTSGGFQGAQAVIKSIWNNPDQNLSYVDLMQIMKQGMVKTLLPTQIDAGLKSPR